MRGWKRTAAIAIPVSLLAASAFFYSMRQTPTESSGHTVKSSGQAQTLMEPQLKTTQKEKQNVGLEAVPQRAELARGEAPKKEEAADARTKRDSVLLERLSGAERREAYFFDVLNRRADSTVQIKTKEDFEKYRLEYGLSSLEVLLYRAALNDDSEGIKQLKTRLTDYCNLRGAPPSRALQIINDFDKIWPGGEK